MTECLFCTKNYRNSFKLTSRIILRLATSRPFRSEKVIWSDEVARASASDVNYWKGLLESLDNSGNVEKSEPFLQRHTFEVWLQ